MAALCNTCRSIPLRMLSSKGKIFHSFVKPSVKVCVVRRPQLYLLTSRSLSVSPFCALSEHKSQESESTLPLSVLLKQAEEKVKNSKEDEEKKKKERKQRFAKYQRWAMYVTGTMLAGISLLTVYELGESSSILSLTATMHLSATYCCTHYLRSMYCRLG